LWATIGFLVISYLLNRIINPRILVPLNLEQPLDLVWQLYQFDRELRLLVSDAIEKIEVAFRASMTEVTSEEFGLFWYTAREFYRDTRPYENLMRDVHKVLRDKQEVFIKHYLERYSEPQYPPLWIIMETLSFGSCSKMFANIQQLPVRRRICELIQVKLWTLHSIESRWVIQF
jgi:abortive infection bacteriophage resistance protein